MAENDTVVPVTPSTGIGSESIPVPGSITTVDKRRFRVIPLTLAHQDRAGVGEIVVDRDTGDFYIVDDEGNLKSRTSSLDVTIHDEFMNSINELSYMYNHNRRVYRLFFTKDFVRLDVNLIMDDSCAYYRVRDISDNGIYYVTTLTAIKSKGVLANTLIDNHMYFVEFYNKKREQISCMPFSAKAALYFDEADTPESVAYIYITTNKDIAYVGEDPTSLLCQVIAVYDDGTEKDITDYSSVDVDTSRIDWTIAGDYMIRATYIYDIDDVITYRAEKKFTITDDAHIAIADVIVVPRKIVNLNDGSREIRLTVVVYYIDGTCKDVSDECIISAFDPTAFNVEQTIVVKVNAGTVNVWEETYVICVNDDGSAGDYELRFTEEHILYLDDSSRTDYPESTLYYRVRDPEDLTIFYTPTYNELHYRAIYTDDAEHKLATNKNVIVEFYNFNKTLLDSDVYTCRYISSNIV